MQIQEDFLIRDVLWYKIGGKVKYYLRCESREDIVQASEFVKEQMPNKLLVCGMGSNLIFSDNYFDGAVIQIATPKVGDDIVIDNTTVTAYAGTMLGDVISFAFDHSLTGLEWAGGLPGTVGAGVRGNVGAYGGEVKDSLLHAEVLDFSEDIPVLKVLTNEQLDFVYRGSLIKSQKNLVVISATFALQKSSQEDVAAARQIAEKNIQSRATKHPLEYPNCGSVFKNLRDKEQIEKVLSVYPEFRDDVRTKWYGKVAVASLIEKLGFKGYRIGDAQVSEKHALFIVNLGHATSKDVLQIINDIQEKFRQQFGFAPEVEVEIVQ